MYSNDPIEDIKLTIEKHGYFTVNDKTLPIVEKFLEELSAFDFSRKYIPTTAAMGDTYKYSTSYTLGNYDFEYYHVLPEGEIASAELKIKDNRSKGSEIDELLHF